MQRRDFLKSAALASAAASLAGCNGKRTETVIPEPELPVTQGWQSCYVNCGSNCPIKFTVQDGQITQLETDDHGDDQYESRQIRACPRGRSLRQRVYSDERILYPMKRVGPRGSGEFVRISWDDALTEIHQRLEAIYQDSSQGGPESVFFPVSTGTSGMKTSGTGIWKRLFHQLGGYLGTRGSYSTHQVDTATQYTYGIGSVILNGLGSSTREIERSDLVLCFGYNPQETFMSGGGVSYEWSEALHRSDAEVIMIDPRYTESAGGKEQQWLPIRPGTDAALVAGIVYALWEIGAVDDAHVDRYAVGWTEASLPESAKGKNASYKAYILGDRDGVAKTPEWAASMTAVPAATIRELAAKLHRSKAPFIQMGWGLQRQANGENSARAIYTLVAIVGKFGLPGTSNAVGAHNGTHAYITPGIPAGANPVTKSIPCFLWTDAIERDLQQEPMTALTHDVLDSQRPGDPTVQLERNIRAIIVAGSNMLGNQHSNINRTHRLLAAEDSKVDFVLVSEIYMTPTARFADILLPEITQFETEDLVCDGWHSGDMANLLATTAAIAPRGESRSAYDICADIAERFGIRQTFTEGRTKAEWVRHLWQTPQASSSLSLPDFDEAKAHGVYREYLPASKPGFADFRADPQANPLKTPSGKIEIYSEAIANLTKDWDLPEGDEVTALPEFRAPWEGGVTDDPDYPFQVAVYHTKGRAHSSFHSHKVLREAIQDALWINPEDAAALGIQNNDTVRVSSRRGVIVVPARVTPRVMPGVAGLGQGAWRNASEVGQEDMGGCINTLTDHRPSPLAKGCTGGTLRVKIERA
ncbi:DMSO/selenate family reductase complex A subunit [Ferrimonas balearica]|uniref:DMSO/selenate family reductase complex A subunit n=1 Tax=Ferrimonas balearica TaxID=44012 RepID=UPI001F160488|nr:DMSO/selenate family reductase complex A subunit [Ferrimonas balearica]MBY6019637.1 molybdopterin-dependent oxidoreductase [Halomonas denitrificans]MBY6096703.1 molybdopterin-dependent oxidoreductase [Ferrimonas balearica]